MKQRRHTQLTLIPDGEDLAITRRPNEFAGGPSEGIFRGVVPARPRHEHATATGSASQDRAPFPRQEEIESLRAEARICLQETLANRQDRIARLIVELLRRVVEHG